MNWLFFTIWLLIVGTAAGVLLMKRFRRLGWIVLFLVALMITAVTVGTVVLWDAPEPKGDADADYGLLLGCALQDGKASDELLRRCELALEWMENHPDRYLVVSGGDPGNQGVTEAAVMAAWLRNHGADPERLLIEDQAADTRENLLRSKELVEALGLESETVAVITSEYHQGRAAYFAGKLGQRTVPVSCKTPMPEHLFAAVRESYAFLKAVVETI